MAERKMVPASKLMASEGDRVFDEKAAAAELPPPLKGRIWLCVDKDDGKFIRVFGDTGRGMLARPFLPGLCEYGGWQNHGPHCGFYQIKAES